MIKKAKNLAEAAAENILAMITIDRKYNIGDKLPNENDLSHDLQISRTTLRKQSVLWLPTTFWK